MENKILKRFTSVSFWLGIYFLSYGLQLELAQSAPRFDSPARVLFDVSIIGLSLTIALRVIRLARVKRTALQLFMAVPLVIIFAAVLLYLPWFAPSYYSETRFGLTEEAARAFAGVFKVVLLCLGAFLIGKSRALVSDIPPA